MNRRKSFATVWRGLVSLGLLPLVGIPQKKRKIIRIGIGDVPKIPRNASYLTREMTRHYLASSRSFREMCD